MYRARARVKMYAENTPHAEGHNPQRFNKAKEKLKLAQEAFEKVTAKHIDEAGLKLLPTEEEEQQTGVTVAR